MTSRLRSGGAFDIPGAHQVHRIFRYWRVSGSIRRHSARRYGYVEDPKSQPEPYSDRQDDEATVKSVKDVPEIDVAVMVAAVRRPTANDVPTRLDRTPLDSGPS